MLEKRIKKWFAPFRKNAFAYKDGFFELSYLANSPQTIVESCINMPFNKHHATNQEIVCDNPFFKGQLHYQELSSGLWVFYSDVYYKTNICFNVCYDKYLPRDWYVLSYNIIEKEFDYEDGIGGGASKSWRLLSPGSDDAYRYFKGTQIRSVFVYFRGEWLIDNVFNDLRLSTNLKGFFYSNKKKLLITDDSNAVNSEVKKITETILEKGNQGAANVLGLKIQVYNFMHDFFLNANSNLGLGSSLASVDVLRQLRIERFLKENLEGEFMGITYLSHKFKLSSSKLKSDFKTAYGVSLLQYFRRKQMLLAKDLILNNDLKISDLSLKFGYVNASKFSKTYEKHVGVLPSYHKKK